MNLAAVAPEVESPRAGWRGQLALQFGAERGRTVLSRRMRSGPLSVQRPFYPEHGGMHVYILHPPGGVVGGDILEISVDIAPDAEVLLTTPGAAKLYRSAGGAADIRNTLDVSGNLEWMPQENIFFNGANVRQRTHVDLTPQGGFIGWEVHCLGRTASGERFDHGSLDLGINIVRDGHPLLVERLRIEDDSHRAGASLRGYPVFGTFYATAVDGAILDSLRQLQCRSDQEVCGLTLMDDLLVVRYLGHSAEAAREKFQGVWRHVRPLVVGRDAIPPRIWST